MSSDYLYKPPKMQKYKDQIVNFIFFLLSSKARNSLSHLQPKLSQSSAILFQESETEKEIVIT